MIKCLLLIGLLGFSPLFAFEHLDSKNIENKLKDKNVIVDFYATWCPPCKILSSILEDFDKVKPKGVTIYKVDVDENLQLARKYGVRVLPTIIYFKNGEAIKKEVGIKDVPQLTNSSIRYFR